MDFDLSAAQQQRLDRLAPLLDRFRTLPADTGPQSWVSGAAVEAALTAGGWFGDDILTAPLPDRMMIAARLAELPYAIEAATSLIVAPGLGLADLPRPVALITAGRAGKPVRFLPGARSAILDMGDHVAVLDLSGLQIAPLDSMFAVSCGVLPAGALAAARRVPADVADLRRLAALALTAEVTGALRATLDQTIHHVTHRRQFGKPLGALQAIQHRLAEDAIRLDGAVLLGLRAAWSQDSAEVSLATGYALDAIAPALYDSHQFHGALGLAKEHVLHHWTYRLKVLNGELGGASEQFLAAAQGFWQAAG